MDFYCSARRERKITEVLKCLKITEVQHLLSLRLKNQKSPNSAMSSEFSMDSK